MYLWEIQISTSRQISKLEANTVSFTKVVTEALGAFEIAQGIYMVCSQNELMEYLYLSTSKRRCEGEGTVWKQ